MINIKNKSKTTVKRLIKKKQKLFPKKLLKSIKPRYFLQFCAFLIPIIEKLIKKNNVIICCGIISMIAFTAPKTPYKVIITTVVEDKM